MKRYFCSRNLSNSTISFLKYFHDTYVEAEESGFNIKFWSSFERFLNDLPRTTNSWEGCHRSLNQQANIPNSNFARLVEILKTEEELTNFNLERLYRKRQIICMRSDYEKEYKLQQLLKYQHFLGDESYNEALQTILKWKTSF